MIDNSPQLTVRKLEIDLASGFDRHWHSNDAFLSQYYNALSMSFPVGEQSFIDAVRECSKKLPETPEYQPLRATVAQFIGQEATHRRIHDLYNEHLAKQGLVNHWEDWINKRLAFAQKRSIKPIHLLAATAAIEHCTAVFADGTLRYNALFAGANEKMRTLWLWHCAEETEHKAVAFDVYQAVGGNYVWRIRWYLYVLVLFGVEVFAQTCNNLWHDGTLFKPSTWWSAAKFLVGKNGFVWRCTMPLLAYFKRDFHPNHDPFGDNQQLAAKWLHSHAESWRAVR
jgi:uncharacterized protein